MLRNISVNAIELMTHVVEDAPSSNRREFLSIYEGMLKKLMVRQLNDPVLQEPQTTPKKKETPRKFKPWRIDTTSQKLKIHACIRCLQHGLDRKKIRDQSSYIEDADVGQVLVRVKKLVMTL